MIISSDDLTFILLCITAILFFIQLIYLLYIYNFHCLNHQNTKDSNITPSLSVIIFVKNSIEDIRKNLPLVLQQDYPNFEVIVVYEQEEKKIEQELTILQQTYKNLYHTFIPETAKYVSHKKLGLTIGIKASKNDILVFTESNAYPVSNQWLRNIASNFTSGTDFVIGYSNYEKRAGWFNKKIVFDRFIDSMRYLGLAAHNMPYTANGYNLAYRKEVFYKNNGFNKYLYLKRGEDDLFVNEYSNGNNTKVELSAESVVRINQPYNKTDWAQDRLSTYITKKHYKGAGKYISGFDTVSRIIFYISVYSTIALSIITSNWITLSVAVGLFIIRFIIQLFVFLHASTKFKERRFNFSLPLFNIYQPMLNLNFYIKKKLSNKKDFLRK